jgi:hypothetical protein
MPLMNVKGHEFPAFIVKDSFSRRAVHFRNDILHSLKRLGVKEDQSDIPLEGYAMRKTAATAIWYLDGHRLCYSYERADTFVDNLYVVSKVIELEINDLLDRKKSFADFLSAFTEEEDVEEQRKHARETLGLPEDTKDMDVINTHYKKLAKEHHPDTPTGDAEKFKAINRAHKMLKRGLE